MRRLLCILSFVFIAFSLFSQEKRLALVVGNGIYNSGGTLRNPENDARSMKNALIQSGFEVLEYYNLDNRELKNAIDDFGTKMKNYDVGLFFYAGHGIQAKGENYLIPIDAKLSSEQQVEYDCVRADRVLALMDASGSKVNIIILDACRNNPFERSWTRSTNGRGLAFMDAPSGTLIAYATAPGRTASDGSGKNGLYTEAILESMYIPEINILQLFQNVRSLVSKRSKNEQIPWESTSLIGDFYLDFNPAPDFRSDSTQAETPIQEFNRTSIILQSVAFPGLGLTRISGKPHWIKGTVGYGCIAGSIVLNNMAIKTYDEFLSVPSSDDAAQLLSKSARQDNISEALAYTAIGIWIADLIWTFVGSSELEKNIPLTERSGLSIGTGIDPVSRAPLLGITYQF